MPSSQLKQALTAFLESDKPEVLCVRGAWGTGKTYAWKFWLKEAVSKGTVAWSHCSYCSLFGVNSLTDMKATLFEKKESLSKDAPTARVRFFGLLRPYHWLRDTWRSKSAVAGSAVSSSPYTEKFAPLAPRVLFSYVRHQLICIDDIERRGAGLSISDVLGMVTFLKEERHCKVVLILNDERITPDADRKAFNRYLEKVVDISMAFEPTIGECIKIGLGQESTSNAIIANHLEQLDIRNIRIIQRIRRLVDQVEVMLMERDPRLLPGAIKTLCVFGWVEFMPDEAPPMEFAKKRSLERMFSHGSRDEPDDQKEWNQKLDLVGLSDPTELDLELQIGVRRGYFDEKIIKNWIDELETRLRKADQAERLEAAWKLLNRNLSAPETQVIEAFDGAVRGAAERIPSSELDSVVRLFKRLGHNQLASDLIAYVVKRRTGDYNFFKEGDFDSEVSEALLLNYPICEDEADERPLSEVMVAALDFVQLNVVPRMQRVTVDELKVGLMGLTDQSPRVISALLKLTATASNGRPVRENVLEALKQLVAESAFNRIRLERFLEKPAPEE